ERGLPLAERLIANDPRLAVLILTMSFDDTDIITALRLGVHGYLLKSVGRDELLHAIRTAAHGGTVLSPEVSLRLAELAIRPAGPPYPFAGLSAREREILHLVADGHDNGQIARMLFLA